MHRAYEQAPPAFRKSVADETIVVRAEHLIRSFADPPGKAFLLYGDDLAFPLALRMAAQAMAGGAAIAVVDGGNRFDVHLLSRFARERRISADDFLRRIFISRGFTCYQMEQAVIHRLPAFLRSIGGNTALVFGLLDTFYDEQAPLREVQQILRRLLIAIQQMKEEGVSLLFVSHEYRVQPEARNALFATLKQGVDRVYSLGENGLTLSIQHPGTPTGAGRTMNNQFTIQHDTCRTSVGQASSG